MPPRLSPLLSFHPLVSLLLRCPPLLHLQMLTPAFVIATTHNHQQQRAYAIRERPVHTPTIRRPQQTFDENIRAENVNYVDLDGVFHSLAPLQHILDSFDRKVYQLVCINPNAVDTPPMCKVVSREMIAERRNNSYRAEREKRKERKEKKPSLVLKEVEVSWAISEHDLEHRLRRTREFLMKGFKVSVTLGTKRGMMKQSLDTMLALLTKVRDECAVWGKECAEPDGEIGKKYTMMFEGVRVNKGSENDGEQDDGEKEDENEKQNDGEKEENEEQNDRKENERKEKQGDGEEGNKERGES